MWQQRRFTKEFEDEAVRLVRTSSRTRREIAVTESPWRRRSKIIINSPNWTTVTAPVRIISAGMVGDGRHGGNHGNFGARIQGEFNAQLQHPPRRR